MIKQQDVKLENKYSHLRDEEELVLGGGMIFNRNGY